MQRSSPEGEHRLDEVGGIHDPPRCGPGADDGVDLVDEQDRLRFLAELGEQPFQAFFEIAPVLRAGEEGAEVEGVEGGVRHDLRDISLDDHLGKPLCDGGLADPRIAHEQRVVLAPATQDLDRALDLGATADEGVGAPLRSLPVEVHRKGFERRLPTLFGCLFFLSSGRLGGDAFAVRDLRDPVGEVVHDVETGDALAVEQVCGVGLALPEQGDENVGARHLLLAGGLHVEQGPLQDALKAKGRLGLAIVAGIKGGDRLREMPAKVALELLDVRSAGAKHRQRVAVREQREEQMLHRHELVALFAGRSERFVQGGFELFAKHQGVLGPRRRSRASSVFHGAQKGMLVISRELVHLAHLGLRDLARKGPADAFSPGMDMQHHPDGLFPVHAEEPLEHPDHEFHRSIVVVEQHHLVPGRFLDLGLRLFDFQHPARGADRIRCVRHGARF